MVKILDRQIIKEMERELKEEIKGKLYHKTIVPKLRFYWQILKLVFMDIKSHRPFRSKKETTNHSGIN